MATKEHAPRTNPQENPSSRRLREKLGQRARRIGTMLLPAETKTALYQERELPAGSPEARLAGKLGHVTQDFENRLRAHGLRPRQTETTTTPGTATGRKEVAVRRHVSVQLDLYGTYNRDSLADIQAHAFKPNPLKTDTDIRQYEIERTTRLDETGKLQDVMQLCVTSGPTPERHENGSRKTAVLEDFTRIDRFTLTADEAGQFGAPEHAVFSRRFEYGSSYDLPIPQEPEQVPGERFDAMMTAIEEINLAQPGDGTFDSGQWLVPKAQIAHHGGINLGRFQ